MDGFKVAITGDHKVGLRFDHFPDALYDDLRIEITSLGRELLGRVEAATPELTGKLLGEERLRIFTDKTHIKALVDIAAPKGSGDFAKAGALEYGAHKATKVKAHSMRLDHFWDRKLGAPESVLVAAYSRTPNIDEHAFERGPLAAMAPEVISRLNAVVGKTVAETNL